MTIDYGFSPLDDSSLIVSRMEWLKDFRNVIHIFTKPLYFGIGEYYYRPILILSFMVDALTGGGSPVAYHFTNIVLHLLASWLIFCLFLQHGISRRSSFLLSLVYVVHPINVSVIAWIPGRNDSLLAIFAFSSFIFWMKFAASKRSKFIIYHLLFFSLALMTKENGIVIPALAGIYIALFPGDHRKFPHWKIVTGWSSIILSWIVWRVVILENPQSLVLQSFGSILKSVVVIFTITIERIIFPIHQYVSPNLLDASPVTGALFLPILVYFIIIFKFKNFRKVIFGGLWFILFLVIPEMWVSIFGIGYTYEHRLYLPLFGFLLIISQITLPAEFNLHKYKFYALFLLVFIMYSTKTVFRQNVYKNTETYSGALASESPTMPFASEFRGSILLENGKDEEAIYYFTVALNFDSTRFDIYIKRAIAYEHVEKYKFSLRDLNRAIALDSTLAETFFRRGSIYRHLGKIDDSLADLNRAIQINQTDKNFYNDRGLLYLNLNYADKAIADFEHSIKLDSTYVIGYQNRSAAYFLTGNYDRALYDQQIIENLGGEINVEFLNQIIFRLHETK